MQRPRPDSFPPLEAWARSYAVVAAGLVLLSLGLALLPDPQPTWSLALGLLAYVLAIATSAVAAGVLLVSLVRRHGRAAAGTWCLVLPVVGWSVWQLARLS